MTKFLYCRETNILKVRNYEDIPAITLLRNEFSQAKMKADKAVAVVDESAKWLDWPDFLALVRQLERECELNYKGGSRRSQKSVAASFQRYLIAGLLAFMPPDRQRTFRELELGKTLVKGVHRQQGNKVWIEECENGKWYIWLKSGDYKTSMTYGEQIHTVPDILYPYLDAWLSQWRSVFQPQHSFVFTQQNGKPFSTASSFLSVFKRAAFRITGKTTTPHLVRHMIVTYLKRQGASDTVMRSLAVAMKHSEETQRRIYDRRLPHEHTLPAQDVVLRLATGQPIEQHLTGLPSTVEAILDAFRLLNPEQQQLVIQSLCSPA